MRVRIIRKPLERELDGLKLDGFMAGQVIDMTTAVALWLIAQDYAVLEMRQSPPGDDLHAAVTTHLARERRRP